MADPFVMIRSDGQFLPACGHFVEAVLMVKGGHGMATIQLVTAAEDPGCRACLAYEGQVAAKVQHQAQEWGIRKVRVL